jgi:hypothetical protein
MADVEKEKLPKNQKAEKLYGKGEKKPEPKAEGDDVKDRKPASRTDKGADAKGGNPHMTEDMAMHKRHENERRDLHSKHREEHRDMNKRHDEEKDGSHETNRRHEREKNDMHHMHERQHGEMHGRHHEEMMKANARQEMADQQATAGNPAQGAPGQPQAGPAGGAAPGVGQPPLAGGNAPPGQDMQGGAP